jgi:hypothetical protein
VLLLRRHEVGRLRGCASLALPPTREHRHRHRPPRPPLGPWLHASSLRAALCVPARERVVAMLRSRNVRVHWLIAATRCAQRSRPMSRHLWACGVRRGARTRRAVGAARARAARAAARRRRAARAARARAAEPDSGPPGTSTAACCASPPLRTERADRGAQHGLIHKPLEHSNIVLSVLCTRRYYHPDFYFAPVSTLISRLL